VVGRAGALRVTSVGSLEDASELQDNVAACVPDVIEPVLPAAVTTPAATTNDLTATTSICTPSSRPPTVGERIKERDHDQNRELFLRRAAH